MIKNITRKVLKPLLKNDSPVIKNHLIARNIKTCKTEFSKEVWILKSISSNAEIALKILRRCALVNRAILRCKLCLNQKAKIATHHKTNFLILKFVSKCRFFTKLLLIKFDDNIK